MRLLVTGGRNYNNAEHVNACLSYLHEHRPIHILIDGAATGADTIAWQWGCRNFVIPLRFPITSKDRQSYAGLAGRAGNFRNARMLRDGSPDVIGAFPGGSGTDNMITQGRLAGIPVILFGASTWKTDILRLSVKPISAGTL